MVLFILDLDPIKSAQSLSSMQIMNYIVKLQCSFTVAHSPSFKKNKNANKVIQEVLYSKENYIWFSEFYTALNKLVKVDKSRIIEFKDEYVFDVNKIKFKNSGLIFDVERTDVSIDTLINQNRVMYIQKNLKAQDFPCGYPSWYIKLDGKVYEKYSPRLRRNFRVVYENNRYNYYFADYFNQWVQVPDVPIEIDDFINSLLHNN